LITASEDDASPVIMLWDLRNARAPEKILQGHERGVLSISWCAQDPELLLSCGKDNRTLAWNPTSGDIIGQVRALIIRWNSHTQMSRPVAPLEQLVLPHVVVPAQS
jgi:WD40 repeat protein